MTAIFPKWTNNLPPLLAGGGLLGALTAVFVVSYWFSPYHLDVGHQPEQPILYSHQLHAGELGLDCRYCHYTVEVAGHAAIPSSETCMGCHGTGRVKHESELLSLLRDSYEKDASIPWVKVHQLPEYAYFSHAVHVNANVGCASCHGRVDQMEVVSQVQPLSMGWCLDCHRNPGTHVRPEGVSPTDMAWKPTDESIAAANAKLSNGDILPPEHCGACHR